MRLQTGLCCCILAAGSVIAAEFYPDDPLPREPRPRDASGAVRRKISDYYDFLHQTFGHPGASAQGKSGAVEAQGVNTLGEPMDGDWYTRRHYYRRMSTAELVRGPGNEHAPPAEGKWKIVKAKSEGVTPGFEFVDENGRRYVLKFDPPGYPELATGPDVISSKFFYALGYHVPENYIVHFRAGQLALGEGVTLTDAKGWRRAMNDRDLALLLARAPKDAEGRHRAVASLYLEGAPLGPFKYFGTRKDDPNDTAPHEHRRDLRGLRVFAAWLGHDDSRSINSLDTLVADGGAAHIRHHLIDFGSTLGSASYGPNSPRSGFEYLFQWKPAIRQFLSVGMLPPYWASARYMEYPGLGRFESEKFDPESWVPEYPNPAFLNMLPDDAFWAAKQVMAFRDEEIRAIVKTGQYSDPRVEDALVGILMARRDKIGRAFLGAVLPLDRFAVRGGRLEFEDLGRTHGTGGAERYRYRWFALDNGSGRQTPIKGADTARTPERSGEYVVCEISGARPGVVVRVTLRGEDVVGIARTW